MEKLEENYKHLVIAMRHMIAAVDLLADTPVPYKVAALLGKARDNGHRCVTGVRFDDDDN